MLQINLAGRSTSLTSTVQGLRILFGTALTTVSVVVVHLNRLLFIAKVILCDNHV